MSTATTAVTAPSLGQLWKEQGGIFVGSRLIEGQLHHIIAAELHHDIDDVRGDNVDDVVSQIGEINGHADWRAGDQEDLMLAYVNGREHFIREGHDSVYWSGTLDSDGWRWAVVFEIGFVFNFTRSHEFRVRPFRIILASSL